MTRGYQDHTGGLTFSRQGDLKGVSLGCALRVGRLCFVHLEPVRKETASLLKPCPAWAG